MSIEADYPTLPSWLEVTVFQLIARHHHSRSLAGNRVSWPNLWRARRISSTGRRSTSLVEIHRTYIYRSVCSRDGRQRATSSRSTGAPTRTRVSRGPDRAFDNAHPESSRSTFKTHAKDTLSRGLLSWLANNGVC